MLEFITATPEEIAAALQKPSAPTLDDIVVFNLINGLAVSKQKRADIISNAQVLGIDLTTPHTLVAANLPVNRTEDFIENHPKFNGSNSLFFQQGTVTGVVVSADFPNDLALREAVAIHFSSLTGMRPAEASVGIGQTPETIADFKRSWYQAVAALELGKMEYGKGSVTHHAQDLGEYSLFFSENRHPELRRYVQRYLERLINYDAEHNTEMLQTFKILEEASSEGRNLHKVADSIPLHINTLKYRITRIKEILGYNPKTPLLSHSKDIRAALMLHSALPVMTFLEQVCPN